MDSGLKGTFCGARDFVGGGAACQRDRKTNGIPSAQSAGYTPSMRDKGAAYAFNGNERMEDGRRATWEEINKGGRHEAWGGVKCYGWRGAGFLERGRSGGLAS